MGGLNRLVFFPQMLAEQLGDGVDQEGHEEEEHRPEKERAVEGAMVRSFRQLHGERVPDARRAPAI